MQKRLINHSKCSQELRLCAGCGLRGSARVFSHDKSSSEAKTPRFLIFRTPTPGLGAVFVANTHACSRSTLGSRRVFHWVTQTFLWITHGCSWANCARHTPVATLQPLADGSRPQKQLNPGEARVVVASGVCQNPRLNTNKIRRKYRSIFQHVQESVSGLEFRLSSVSLVVRRRSRCVPPSCFALSMLCCF